MVWKKEKRESKAGNKKFMEKEEIIKEIKNKIEEFALKNNVGFVVLFGSQAVRSAKKESDIDIAIYLNDNRFVFGNAEMFSEILDGLRNVFESQGLEIDIVDLRTADILLRYEIISKGNLLYGDEIDYENYKSFARRDYMDARQLFDLEDLLITKRQNLIGSMLIK